MDMSQTRLFNNAVAFRTKATQGPHFPPPIKEDEGLLQCAYEDGVEPLLSTFVRLRV